jgi:hypothetical protein
MKKTNNRFQNLMFAYNTSKNSFETLKEFLKNEETQIEDLEWILHNIVEGSSTILKEEIDICKNTLQQDCAKVARKYKYLYFATSICHIQGIKIFQKGFKPLLKQICAYAPNVPNKPLPYLWYDLDNGLVDFEGITAEYVKIKIVNNQKEIVKKIVIDLKTKKSITASYGTFIEITTKGSVIIPYEKQESILLLTKNYILIGMYYKHEKCFISLHE